MKCKKKKLNFFEVQDKINKIDNQWIIDSASYHILMQYDLVRIIWNNGVFIQ